MHIKVNGTMTTATVKPKTLDKDGFEKTPAYLGITFKVELNQLTEEELGELLVSTALNDLHDIEITPHQLRMPMSAPSDAQPKEKENQWTEEQIARQIGILSEEDAYRDWTDEALRAKAIEILSDDVPF